jgi:hypothetical protein
LREPMKADPWQHEIRTLCALAGALDAWMATEECLGAKPRGAVSVLIQKGAWCGNG